VKTLTAVCLTLILSTSSLGWGNGGRSTRLSSPKFGMHDWVAYEGYRLAGKKKIAVSIARFTETGGGTIRNTGWMYDQWLSEVDEGDTTDPDSWD
jgi:hypothetical protein